MDGWSFSSLGSGVVALEGVDTEAPSAGAGGATGQLRWLELSFCNVVEEGWMEARPRSLERSLVMLWVTYTHRRQ